MNKNLTDCPACGTKISRSARECPRCGKPRTTWTGVVVAVVVGLILGAFVLSRL